MISIVSSKGTFVKSDITSNDTILDSGGIVIFLSFFMNVLPFLIVYCNSLNGIRGLGSRSDIRDDWSKW